VFKALPLRFRTKAPAAPRDAYEQHAHMNGNATHKAAAEKDPHAIGA
jgi:hypothetical protein